MAVLSPLHFGILLIAQVALGIPWSDRPAARYEGYDLERGPVLYEAYYPEEQLDVEKGAPKIYQEKRYFDRISVPERSYQIPADPYEIPYDPETTDVREEFLHQPNSGYLSAFTASRPQTVQKRDYLGHDQRSKEYVFGRSSHDHLKSGIDNDYSVFGSQPSAYRNQDQEESDFVLENEMNFGGEDVQRIVPINDEFIFGEPPAKMTSDFDESLRNLNQKEIFDTRNFDTGYNRQKEIIRPMPMENIFEPRPQTINYVFSAPKKVDGLKSVKFESESEDNDWPRNYGDNLIQAEIKNADEQELKNQEARITSIEVSQVPHHKIRHHHGDQPKRKYNH